MAENRVNYLKILVMNRSLRSVAASFHFVKISFSLPGNLDWWEIEVKCRCAIIHCYVA